MTFNVNKFKILSIRKSLPKNLLVAPNYSMNNNQLNFTDSMVDLGVTVDSKLTWQTHTNLVVGKAKSKL